MGAFYDEIPTSPDLASWIAEQKIFFVCTAPLASDGNVNVSPKGTAKTLHLDGPKRAWYQDLTGSGSETIAHLTENSRITIMLCAFEGPPRIVRLFGTGRAHFRGSVGFSEFLPEGSSDLLPGSRAVIEISIHKVSTACGYSIPFFEYLRERETLNVWAEKKETVTDFDRPAEEQPDENSLITYWTNRNPKSIDGLPSLGTLRTQQIYLHDDHPAISSSSCCTPEAARSKESASSCASSSSSMAPSLTQRMLSNGVISHLFVAVLVGLILEAFHRDVLPDLRVLVGLAGASVAWLVGNAAGVPVSAPCCAMGL